MLNPWEYSPGGSVVKNPPAKQDMWVQSLGREDPLQKEMAAHPISWEIPWTEEAGGLQSMGCRVRHGRVTRHSNSSPFCYSCVHECDPCGLKKVAGGEGSCWQGSEDLVSDMNSLSSLLRLCSDDVFYSIPWCPSGYLIAI